MSADTYSAAPPTNTGGGADDIESYWNDLPQGTKHKLFGFLELETGMRTVWNFAISALFDNEYDWNVWKTLKSSYVLAADFLHKEKNQEAIYIIFFAALLKEILARSINGISLLDDEAGEAFLRRAMSIKDIFSHYTHLCHAVTYTQSRKAMASF